MAALSVSRWTISATQGKIEIITEPITEGDMPASPKASDAGGEIGEVEVLWELKAYKECCASGHIHIAAEVIIKL